MLGPLLFLFYINKVVDDVHLEIRLFADDTTVFVIVDNPECAAELLNTDLQNMTNWAKQWLVIFSLPKTKSTTISSKRVNHPDLQVGDTSLC